MIKILVVDDEDSIRQTLRLNLVPRGFQVLEAATGGEALKQIKDGKPQLIVLDLGLPDMSGIDVLKEVRTWSKIPIIVLTVTDDESTKVSLLDCGADDFMTKPFSPLELAARINVALRHHKDEVLVNPVFVSGPLAIDLQKKRVEVGGTVVRLSATEFLLLATLVKNAGQVISQEQILREVWGMHAIEQRHYLRIYVGQLRKKLEADPSAPAHILTEPGVGYRIV